MNLKRVAIIFALGLIMGCGDSCGSSRPGKVTNLAPPAPPKAMARVQSTRPWMRKLYNANSEIRRRMRNGTLSDSMLKAVAYTLSKMPTQGRPTLWRGEIAKLGQDYRTFGQNLKSMKLFNKVVERCISCHKAHLPNDEKVLRKLEAQILTQAFLKANKIEF